MLKPTIFALVLIAMAAFVSVIAHQKLTALDESYKVTEPEKADTKAPKGRQGTQNNPVIVKVLPSGDGEANSGRERQEQHNKATNEIYLVWSTVALALFTFTLAGFTAFLWSSTSDLVKDAKENARRQLRAYIVLKTATYKIVNDKIAVEIITTNCGQTPAYELKMWAIADLKHSIDEHAGMKNTVTNAQSVAVVGPGRNMTINRDVQMQAPGIAAVADGTAVLICVGGVTYRDAFKDEHFLNIRLAIGQDYGKFSESGSIPICNGGNDSDDG